jgi:hypothetical protein
MKYLFLILLLGNLTYFVSQFVRTDSSAPPLDTEYHAERLTLLAELPAKALASESIAPNAAPESNGNRRSSVADQSSAKPGLPVDETQTPVRAAAEADATDQVISEPKAEEVLDGSPQNPSASVAQSLSPDIAIETQDVLAPSQRSSADALARGSGGEADGEGPRPANDAGETEFKDNSLQPSQPTATVRYCYSIGPFDSQSAVSVRGRLQGMEISAKDRAITDRELYRYQVFLPRFRDRAAAFRVANELTKKGIKDYYVMTEPGFLNAISLGLFRKKRHADRRASYLRRLGYDPKTEGRYRDVERHWLDFEDSEDRVDEAALNALSPDEPVQRFERPCE